MKVRQIVPGEPLDAETRAELDGAILTRDIRVGGGRWSKGRRLSREDLTTLASEDLGPTGNDEPVTLLIQEPGELHEDDAALRLAEAVRGGPSSMEIRGPSQSRVDLVATADGVVAIRLAALERLNRLDPLEVFTVFDGQIVAPGDLVASIKVGPHLVDERVLAAGERLAQRGGPVVRVLPFRAGLPIAVLVQERIEGVPRERFEASVRAKVEGLGARLTTIDYVGGAAADVTAAMARALAGAPAQDAAAIVLTAGGGSTDPTDPFFLAVEALGGVIVRHGVPAHPGSMVWLGRVGRAAVVGLPSCGAYSRATAADLLLPRLVAGEPPTATTVARLGHGGILNRHQRFRFPAYARELEAPEG
ncbi:MAG: molybdopterin-binding protein [Chloroflexota bacterium]